MTIEITTDDMMEAAEQADRYGTCIFKVFSTDDEPVWLVVQNNHRPGRKRTKAQASAKAAQLTDQAHLPIGGTQ